MGELIKRSDVIHRNVSMSVPTKPSYTTLCLVWLYTQTLTALIMQNFRYSIILGFVGKYFRLIISNQPTCSILFWSYEVFGASRQLRQGSSITYASLRCLPLARKLYIYIYIYTPVEYYLTSWYFIFTHLVLFFSKFKKNELLANCLYF